jgi:dipeptidyl aminopeptidase/acylaminoacyl peptidase
MEHDGLRRTRLRRCSIQPHWLLRLRPSRRRQNPKSMGRLTLSIPCPWLRVQYIENNLPYVNTESAMALGASYSGYMMNWIQGNDLGRKFKALFTHNGVFSTLSQYASEELWFMQHDFNVTLWDNWDDYVGWNPANHTGNWATPHLIVHNEKDYRLPISERLSAFNVLQTRGAE